MKSNPHNAILHDFYIIVNIIYQICESVFSLPFAQGSREGEKTKDSQTKCCGENDRNGWFFVQNGVEKNRAQTVN